MPLLLLTYTCLVVFIAGLTWRIIKYARLPVHLRWELYPVAHEVGKPDGGSYLEEEEWWRKPRRVNMLGEASVFMREVIFFREYFRGNRRFWIFVYPFHLGLFLLLFWVLMLIIGSVFNMAGSNVSAASDNAAALIFYYLALVSGVAAFILGIFGTAGLLFKRLSDEDLRSYTDPIDYFNLVGILFIFLTGLLFWIIEDRSFTTARSFVQGLIIFQPAAAGALMTANVVLSALFLAYMPFTRMMHYVAKYFTYHKVRWDDEPNKPGSGLESKLKLLLSQPAGWSAPHINPGDSWSRQAEQTGADGKHVK
jgi:nitrate reductase gamma subunit